MVTSVVPLKLMPPIVMVAAPEPPPPLEPPPPHAARPRARIRRRMGTLHSTGASALTFPRSKGCEDASAGETSPERMTRLCYGIYGRPLEHFASGRLSEAAASAYSAYTERGRMGAWD